MGPICLHRWVSIKSTATSGSPSARSRRCPSDQLRGASAQRIAPGLKTFARVVLLGSADRVRSSPFLRWDRSRVRLSAPSHSTCVCSVYRPCGPQFFVPVRCLLRSTIDTILVSRLTNSQMFANVHLDAPLAQPRKPSDYVL